MPLVNQYISFYAGTNLSNISQSLLLDINDFRITNIGTNVTLGNNDIVTMNPLNITTPSNIIINPFISSHFIKLDPIVGQLTITDGIRTSIMSLDDITMSSLVSVAGNTSLIDTLNIMKGPTGGYVTVNTPQVITGSKTFTEIINGTATNATNINVTSNNATGQYYLPFVSNTGNTEVYIDMVEPKLTYNPTTGSVITNTINCTNLNAQNLTSNISSSQFGIKYATYFMQTNITNINLTTNQLFTYCIGNPVNRNQLVRLFYGTEYGQWVGICNLSRFQTITVLDPSGNTAYPIAKSNNRAGLGCTFIWVNDYGIGKWITCG